MEKGTSKYDWVALKQEFFESDVLEVTAFIRQKLDKEQAKDRNVANHIKGWTEDKKRWKQEVIDKVQKEAEKKLIEKLKISLEDLLLNKKLLFGLDSEYLRIQGKMLKKKEGNTDTVTAEEMLFFKNYQDKIKDIYKRIQIELGLPTNIAELQGTKEKPLVFIDLVREAEKINAESRGKNKDSAGGEKEPGVGN